jgi:hypothetical protein
MHLIICNGRQLKMQRRRISGNKECGVLYLQEDEKGVFVMTDKIEIKLSAEQYTTLIRFLYFADYFADRGFMSEFKSNERRNDLYGLLTQIYECGDKINLPKSFTMTTITSSVRFSDEEEGRLRRQVESDIEDIARHIFARDFAKRDLKKLLDAINAEELRNTDVYFEAVMSERDTIWKRMKLYIKEFEDNGIKNLRFKMFYKLKKEEEE